MRTPISRVVSGLTALLIALAALVATAPPASAKPTGATISETRWRAGTSIPVTLSWTEPQATTSVMVRSPWPWPAAYAPKSSGTTNVTTTGGVTGGAQRQSIKCATQNGDITFTIETATITSAPICKAINNPDGYWTGFWIEGPGLTIAAGSTISVAIASGLVTARSTAGTDTWIVGPKNTTNTSTNGANDGYNKDDQVLVSAEAYVLPTKVGFDPATDTAPTGEVTLTISDDLTTATCTAPPYTIAPDRYEFEFSARGQLLSAPIRVSAPTNSTRFAIPKNAMNAKLTCNVIAFALNSAFSSSDTEQVGPELLPPEPPLAPTNVVVKTGYREVTVSWDAAELTLGTLAAGYDQVSNYLVTALPIGQVCITRKTDENMLTCRFTSLTPGVMYNFAVQGLNPFGWGQRSSTTAAVAPQDVKVSSVTRTKKLLGLYQEFSVKADALAIPDGTKVDVQVKFAGGSKFERLGTMTAKGQKVSFTSKITGAKRNQTMEVRLAWTGSVNGVEKTIYTNTFERTPPR